MNRTKAARLFLLVLTASLVYGSASASPKTDAAGLNVTLISDEAEAVLAILEKKRVNGPIAEEDWQRVFASEGYRRLKKRETEMGRDFCDEDFRTFVLSETTASRTGAFRKTLEAWTNADLRKAAGLALAYLPAGTSIRAKVYPVIKPRENSFVFELKTDPAIFMYLDPGLTREQFENTVAHELHHVGYAASCLPRMNSHLARFPQELRPVVEWAGAFGEGMAMLAASGGPDVHPHAWSKAEDRERWDRDVANIGENLRLIESFFVDIAEGRLTDPAAITKKAMSFFGVQGPWYTIGWQMSATIEKAYGRAKLIDVECEPVQLLVLYNQAAAEHNRSGKTTLPLWSEPLLDKLRQR